MGIMDGVIGKVVGSVMGSGKADALTDALNQHGGGDEQRSGNILGAAMGLIEKHGGLDGVLDKLNASGLQDQAASWVGKGENRNISSEQLEQALGETEIDEAAVEIGVSRNEAGSALSDVLPGLIDTLTPDGKVTGDAGDLLAKGLDMLKNR